MCPACCKVFDRLREEDNRLDKNGELAKILQKVMQACDEDKSGKYQALLEQMRERKVAH